MSFPKCINLQCTIHQARKITFYYNIKGACLLIVHTSKYNSSLILKKYTKDKLFALPCLSQCLFNICEHHHPLLHGQQTLTILSGTLANSKDEFIENLSSHYKSHDDHDDDDTTTTEKKKKNNNNNNKNNNSLFWVQKSRDSWYILINIMYQISENISIYLDRYQNRIKILLLSHWITPWNVITIR